MPASSRLRAWLALLLFPPLLLFCFLFASHLCSIWIGTATPDRFRLALATAQILGLGLPCLLAAEFFRLGRSELGIPSIPWRTLLPAAFLVLGLWPGILALDSLREAWVSDPERQDLFKLLVSTDPAGFLKLLATVSVVAPLMEEIAFRGILQPLLEKAWGKGLAILLSAGLFSLYHMSVEQYLAAFLLGIALGWLRSAAGSLWPCILGHALHNAVTAAGMAFLPSWAGPPSPMPPLPLWAGGLLLALVAARALKTPPAQG